MKPGTKTPLILAALVAVAVIAGTIAMRGGTDRAPVAASDDGAGVEEPVAAPARTTAPAPRMAAAANRPTDKQWIGDHIERRAARRAEHQARTQALRQQSAQRFESEQVDPAWAPRKETTLTGIAAQTAFQTANAQPQSIDVSCRSSMCRIDGQFETSGKAEDWLLLYMSSVGAEMPHSVVSRSLNPDGTTRVEIYGRGR